MSVRGRRVLLAIDEAEWIAPRVPVLFMRCSRRHMTCAELVNAYDAIQAGVKTDLMVQLDDPALRLRTKQRRQHNAMARASRKRNRRAA